MNRMRFDWMGLALLVLLGMQATPAQAEDFVAILQLDVNCGNGLRLQRASGVPDGAVHTYVFGGFCSLWSDISNGTTETEGRPPLSATAHWDKASRTYTETLHLLAPGDYATGYASDSVHVGTGPEKATFKCDVDPVINRTAHCTLITQSNETGWRWGRHDDGFAWQARHNLPLLIGRATARQAASLSRHTAIDCRGLHLTDATGVPNGGKRSYTFGGTCRLYHTKSGSQGPQVTQVLVSGDWEGQQATEGVLVLTGDINGGGAWTTAYTCNEDPWLNRNAQCSEKMRLSGGVGPPVYDPITDLIARHPVALGMAKASQAAKLSKAHHSSKPRHTAKPSKADLPRRVNLDALHKGLVLPRSPHLQSLPKPKLIILNALASPVNNCDPNHLVEMDVVIRNEGGPLFAHTRSAYVRAIEPGPGGAHLISHHVSLPAISTRGTWHGVLVVGTRKSFFPKLPGRHTLLVSIGPGNVAPGTLPYISTPSFRAAVNIPSGYCQPLRKRNINALMRGATLGGIHKTVRGKQAAGLRHGMRQPGVRKKLTPAAPVHRLNRPVQRLPKSQPTAGPRHATQQRGVQKKLTPVTPALRFTPAAPVRRLSLPAVQLRLNR